MSVCSNSLFGNDNNYIKVGNGEFIAVEGSNISDKLLLSDLRMPYKQILKGKILLKEGQINYLLNFLGLGDNATFLAIKAKYNSGSVIEQDNFIEWSYLDDITNKFTFSQLLVLTGNSTNRIKQLYLTNPNTKYNVYLEIMIGVIDYETSYFVNDSQNSSTFNNLTLNSIKTHIQGESIVIIDTYERPSIYITLSHMESMERIGSILLINDSSLGDIYLHFKTEYDCVQAQSLLNYILENPDIDINSISNLEDNESPIIYFNEKAGDYGYDMMLENYTSYGLPFNTSQGSTFSTTISLSSQGGTITLSDLIYLLIDEVIDNRDNIILMKEANLILENSNGENLINIESIGDYTLKFNLSDIANNNIDDVIVNINIIN